jgi:excisionase family DNA binding protein
MDQDEQHKPLAYRIEDAVRVCGLGRTSLYKLIKTGELYSVVVGGRRLIPAESLKKLLNEGR